MADDLKTALSKALGLEAPQEPCTVQKAFNAYRARLCGIKIGTPLPETVGFCVENFPHLVKLEFRNTLSHEWSPAKCPLVLPDFERGCFRDIGYRYDPRRERALLNVTHLLRSPHRIHENLCHGQRGPGTIRGQHVYVREHQQKEFWVAFTLFDPKLGFSIVVSSFYVSGNWLKKCAKMPPVFERQRTTHPPRP